MVLRFLRFNAVGGLGVGVQVGVLWFLAGPLHLHYLLATALAVEVSVLHNFVWHLRWTWASRAAGPQHLLFRCAAFHAGNGVVSMLGNLGLMPLFVGRFRLHYLLANLLAIACTGLLNFALGERIFDGARFETSHRPLPPVPRQSQPSQEDATCGESRER
jgi:putative flippase GtrA